MRNWTFFRLIFPKRIHSTLPSFLILLFLAAFIGLGPAGEALAISTESRIASDRFSDHSGIGEIEVERNPDFYRTPKPQRISPRQNILLAAPYRAPVDRPPPALSIVLLRASRNIIARGRSNTNSARGRSNTNSARGREGRLVNLTHAGKGNKGRNRFSVKNYSKSNGWPYRNGFSKSGWRVKKPFGNDWKESALTKGAVNRQNVPSVPWVRRDSRSGRS